MAVKIRMYRIGNNKRPFFRVVATDERRKINGRFLEIVGWYDPKVEGKNFELKNERIEYWKSKGAILSASVASLLRRGRQAAKRA
jgi:small subunit ribosomal protein S16